MNKQVFTIIISFLFVGVLNAQNKIEEIFQMNIEGNLISKGDNFPDFNEKKDSMDRFLITLHKNFSVKDFQNYTKFSNEKMENIISLLESKKWLHKVNNEYKPTIFIADAKDGELLYKYAKPISKQITKSILKNLPKIKSEFEKTDIAKTQNFKTWSFLILSNVLLDSWQIDNVEKYFLKQEIRPLRNGKNYYYEIAENTNDKIESFGIYGNQYEQIAENKYISIYGNNRNDFNETSSKNIVSAKDNEIFKKMSRNFLPDLLKVLENNRNYAEEIYSKLGYKNEITFEEFFIWWYHFIYTQSTNELHKKKIIEIPKSGNFDYMITE
jgi:hypothetical protein